MDLNITRKLNSREISIIFKIWKKVSEIVKNLKRGFWNYPIPNKPFYANAIVLWHNDNRQQRTHRKLDSAKGEGQVWKKKRAKISLRYKQTTT